MKRGFTILLLMAAMTGPVQSATLAEAVVAELVAKGYEEIDVTRTWLGRVVITAELDGRTREITLNPKTGQILRDFFRSPAAEHDSTPAPEAASPDRKARRDDTVQSTGAEDATVQGGAASPGSEETGTGVLLDSVSEGSGG